MAVTNYHVIDGAYSARILRADTNMACDVLGVYDYSKEYDWAVLKIAGNGFPFLERSAGDVVGGAIVYAIGSPEGLDNTISEGIVSNPSRQLNGIPYIQTSAAISHGSSGGALINKFGDVIGITSAGIETGENIGFALPIAVVEGYKMNGLSTLDAIAKKTSAAKQEDATKKLCDFITNNATEANEAIKTYSVIEYEDRGYKQYSLSVLDSQIWLVSSYQFGSTGHHSVTIDLPREGYTSSLLYLRTIGSGKLPDIYGRSSFDTRLFNGENIVFESVGGSALPEDKGLAIAVYQQLTNELVREGLSIVDKILNTLGYSVSVFGFQN